MRRFLKWAGIALGGIAVLVLALVLAWDWNWFKSEATQRASAAAGRDVAIEGDIDVDLSLTPRVRLDGVRVANAEWGRQPTMASVERLEFTIELLELLRGRVVLPDLKLIRPELLLEKNREGAANWEFGASEAEAAKEAAVPEERGEFPIIGHLLIDDGTLSYIDPGEEIDLSSRVDTAVGEGNGDEQVTLTGDGTFQGRPFRLEIVGGSLLMLREKNEPYPLSVRAAIGETRGAVEGTVTEPVKLAGMDLELSLEGPSLSELFPVFGIPLPPTRDYALTGRLQREGTRWSFTDFAGRVGESDLAGNLSLETQGERRFMQADLVSKRLDFADLGGFIGITPGEDEPDPAPGRLLPQTKIALERLRAMNLEVQFEGRQVEAPDMLPIENVSAHFNLRNGRLVIEPLEFGIAGGSIAGGLVLDGSDALPSASADLELTGIGLSRFFRGSEFAQEMGGTFGGRVDLLGTGHTIAELLGTSDGELSLVMGGGKISPLVVELIGLDVAEALLVAMTENEPVALRCAVADFEVQNGLMRPKVLVLDTEDSSITGEGAIDLKREGIDLELLAHPKDPSPLSARAPVHIEGWFVDPGVSVDAASLAARGAAALALGALLTPLAALLPLIEPGLGEDQPCRPLIERAEEAG